MIAVLMINDLEMFFRRTCPRPDLSHLPPQRVIEIGNLLVRSMGAGTLGTSCGCDYGRSTRSARFSPLLWGAQGHSIVPGGGGQIHREIGCVEARRTRSSTHISKPSRASRFWAQPIILEGEGLLD